MHFLSLLMETETVSETSKIDPICIFTTNPFSYLFCPANMSPQTCIPEVHFRISVDLFVVQRFFCSVTHSFLEITGQWLELAMVAFFNSDLLTTHAYFPILFSFK
jgi:hypothetical protein